MSNKRVRLTVDQKIQILVENLKGKLDTVEPGKCAMEKFALSKPLAQQTISKIISSADELYSNISLKTSRKSAKSPKHPQLDAEVKKYVEDMNNLNQHINRESVIKYVRMVALTKYKIPQGEINFSDGWLPLVFKRIGVKSRLTHGESTSEQLKKIAELLRPYNSQNILNFDETGLYYNRPLRRTINSQPVGGMKNSKEHLTFGLLCNADGSYRGHPIVIVKHKYPTGYKDYPKLHAMTAIGKPHYIEYHCSPNAWMKKEIFEGYVKRLDRAFGREKRKVAILLDNAFVHKVGYQPENILL
ncbi:CENP-B protein 2, partial [Choanephora cucurbitarum]